MGAIKESLEFDVSGAVTNLTKAATTVEGLEKSSGAMGSAFGRAAGAASLLGGRAGEAARTMADLADVVEIGAQGFSAFGLSTGALLAVLGPLALVGGGVVLWLREMDEAAEKTRQEVERLTTAVQAAHDANNSIVQNRRVLEVRGAVARGELPESALDSVRSQIEAEQAYSAQLALTARNIDLARKALEEAERTSKEAVQDEKIRAELSLPALRDALRDAEEAHQGMKGEVSIYAADLLETITLEKDAANQKRDAARATKDATKTVQEHAQALQDAGAAREAAILRDQQIMSDYAAQIAEEFAPGAVDIRTGLVDPMAELSERARDLGLTMKDTTDPVIDLALLLVDVEAAAAQGLGGAAELATSLRREIDEAAAGTSRLEEAMAGGLGKGLGVAGQVSGGFSGAMGALQASGPVGAMVAQVINIIKGIEDGAIEDIHANMMELFNGLGGIPDQLAAGVENSIREGIPALGEGLGEMVANLPEMSVRIAKASIKDMAVAHVEAFKSFFDELFGGIAERRRERQERRWARDHGTAESRTADGGGSTARSSGAGRAAGRTLSPSRGAAEDMGGQLWGLLNRTGARNNLRSSSGVPYGTSGAMRIVVED